MEHSAISIDMISSESSPQLSFTDSPLSPRSDNRKESTKPVRRRNSVAATTTTTSRKKTCKSNSKPKPTFQCSACSAVFKRSEHLVRHYRSRMSIFVLFWFFHFMVFSSNF